jgi:hypothetical protein
MLKRTNKVSKSGHTIYVDEKGKQQVLPRVHHKSFGSNIPSWCFRFIQPIRATGHRWNLKKNRMQLSTK